MFDIPLTTDMFVQVCTIVYVNIMETCSFPTNTQYQFMFDYIPLRYIDMKVIYPDINTCTYILLSSCKIKSL